MNDMPMDERHADGWNRWWKGSNEWIKIIKEPNNWHICTLYFMVDNSIKTKFKTIVRTNECGIPLKVNTKWIYWNWVIFIRFSAFTFLFVLFGFYTRINFRSPSGLMKRRRHFTKFDTTQAQTESLQFLCKCLRYRRNCFLWVKKGKHCVTMFNVSTRQYYCTFFYWVQFQWENRQIVKMLDA